MTNIVKTLFWVGAALIFNLVIYFLQGPEKALEFFTAYLVEKSLSIDNLFVFFVIFSHFKVPLRDQHRILNAGIIGAVVLRLALILVGVTLISHFHWMIYLLGLFLAFTGVRLLFAKEKKAIKIQFVRRYFPNISPFMLVLIAIETTDVIFALDSIPAVFAITLDPFIVYTSNLFAILGLRSLYFVLVQFMDRFRHLRFGLSAILVFVGTKMAISPFYTVSLPLTLGIIAAILTISIFSGSGVDDP